MSLMPMNVSVGAILIGVVGVAYGIYIYSKVSDRNIRSKRKSNEICPVCEKKVDLDNFTNSVTCKGCARVICKKSTCSDWIATNNECDSCSNNRKIHNRAGEWLLKQLNQRFRVTTAINFDEVVLKNSKFNNSINDKENNTTNLIPLDQREKVRQFLEELLSSMLETTSLNHVPVGQLYKSSEYIRIFTRYHKHLTDILYNLENSIHRSLSDLPIWDHECPGISHIELKCLITKIISEAVKLPELIFDYGELVRPIEDLPYFDPKRYQELLATAVLNKIVQSYRNPQNEHRPENFTEIPYDSDNDVEKGKKLLEISVTANYIEPELMSNITDDLTEQPMSITIEEQIEEISIDDSPTNSGSFSSNVSKNDETNLSDYLQKHHVPLPDLSTESDTNDDDILSLRSNGTDATWEDNWLFKSRKLKTEPSIGMLVPSPTENVRTLIGDKNADEISDLSEAGSDVEDAPSDSTDEGISVPNILIQNKKIIGGKHDLESFKNLKKDTDPQLSESLISLSASSDSNVAEAKNDTFLIENDYIKVDIPLIDIEFDTLKKIPKESKENEAINSVILDNENNYNTKENIINVNEQNLIDIATNDDIIEENKLTNTALTDDDTKTNGINIVKQSPPIPEINAGENKNCVYVGNNLITLKNVDLPNHNSITVLPSPLVEHRKYEFSICSMFLGNAEIIDNTDVTKLHYAVVHDSIIEDSLNTEYTDPELEEIEKNTENNIQEKINSPTQRYQSPIFENLIPKTQPVVIKVSELFMNLSTVRNENSNDDKINIQQDNNSTAPQFANNNLNKDELLVTSTPLLLNDQHPILTSNKVNTSCNVELLTTPINNNNTINDQVTFFGTENNEEKTNDIKDDEQNGTELTDDNDKDNKLIPGSIAEREHLKWENAAPIANNPYSPEVLQNRLNQRTPTNCIDLRNVPKINEEPAETPSSPEKLQDIFKAEQPIYKRFGRDYYINEAKKASGERKRRSEMNLRLSSPDDQEFDHSESPTDKQIRTRSKSATDENLNENIFAARPIQVNEDDPILQQATKIESLSTDDRDFYLLPVNTLHSLTSSDSSIVSPLLESLSEDSDSARIYDIKTCEKKIIRQNLEEPQNCTISEIIIDERQTPLDFVGSELLNIPEIYQETKEDNSLGSNSVEIVINNNKHNHHQEIKLPKEDIKNKKMEDEIATVISIHEPEINENNNGHPENNHQVIEEELINALPSVKLLAKTFSVKKETEPILPINRPKTIAWQPKSSEIYRSTSSMNSSPESFAPQYNQNYHPVSPGYSITARSISKQFREELKDSGSSNGTTTEMKDIQIIRSQSPPRTPSPVPIPGQLKNSIAFFENLKNK